MRRFALHAPLSPYNLVERLTSADLPERAVCALRAFIVQVRLLFQPVLFMTGAMHFCAVGRLVDKTTGPGVVLRVV